VRLSELLRNADLGVGIPPADPDICAVVADSRAVNPGSVFVAIVGTERDGHNFLREAEELGAAAAVVQRPVKLSIPTILVPDTRLALSRLAAAIQQFPAGRLITIGVTGTDGKTTTSLMIAHLLNWVGIPSGAITTVGIQALGQISPNSGRQTTPEAWEIHSLLADFERKGIKAAVVESTSHGLAQHRVTDCQYNLAVFTNVTHEHLDYHGTLEQYRRDKARLIELVNLSAKPPSQKAVILNRDDPLFDYYRGWSCVPTLSYSVEGMADVVASDVSSDIKGTSFTINYCDQSVRARLNLPGPYNLQNSLAAVCAALAMGIPLDATTEALDKIPAVPGRMQFVDVGQPFSVIVDYAHTPEAFRRVLPMVRNLTAGRLICVFGSAGQRDRAKRWLQGELAGAMCDVVVLTDEDPRNEDRWAILNDIASGVMKAGRTLGSNLLLIPERRQAIAMALSMARAGDTVLLLGKGHERTIEYADRSVPWEEATAAEEELKALGYEKGAV
jgi:UDP-N-acetylmuramoyl-L-alanyl-D-glutamate--2,6-diaminopimelate ligase